MIAILDAPAPTPTTLKDTDCSISHIIPDVSELFSDEMTRSVPSIRSQSSQEFISCVSSYNTSRRNSRKGRPNRSCSWQDTAPGIVFKFGDDSQSIMIIPNNISIRDCGFIPSLKQTSETEIVGKKFRSRSITSLEGFLPVSLAHSRPRSFSIDCTNSSTIVSTNNNLDFSLLSQSSSATSCVNETEEEGINEGFKEFHKSSITSLNNSNTSNIPRKKFTSSNNSLAHLVPNKLLSTLSRRISSHSSHELCRCSSCNQSVTPYWRDGWADDVMLCNACGLRFQKFAQRCMYCKYIPRKEDGVEDTCPQCQAPWEC